MPCACKPLNCFVLLLMAMVALVAGCDPNECAPAANCSVGDDDSAGDDSAGDDDAGDDDAGDDDAGDDDDSTPDPENPFPGDSIHQGDYSGQMSLTYTGQDAGVQFCAGTAEFNITGSGTLSGQGTCVVSLDGQPLEPEATVSFTMLAEMTDVGNMNSPQLHQTMSYASGEELSYLPDGSASQGMLDLQWGGAMPLPDGERTFAGHASAELVSGR